MKYFHISRARTFIHAAKVLFLSQQKKKKKKFLFSFVD